MGDKINGMNIEAELTYRENEIVEMIALGYSQKMIAYHFNISQKTVDNHVVNIKKKVKINTNCQIATFYLCRRFGIPPSCLVILQSTAKLLIGVFIVMQITTGDQLQVRRTGRTGRTGRRNEYNIEKLTS